VSDWLVEQDLSVDRLESVLQQLPNLHAVQLCGNYGDPVISANILEAVTIIKKYAKKIQVHTNGSLRNEKWWASFAELLGDIDHDVWFGIDGLAGVHEIYRQGTDYTKIIKNATAFITSGGYATWQFIPYTHNEHQIKDCIKISQQTGFKKFKLAKLFRGSMIARHYKTGNEFTLSAPAESIQTIMRMPNNYRRVEEANCMHMSQPSVYLAANGRLSTCCYFDMEKTFDSVDELLYNEVNLKHPLCLNCCGSN
jgi:hypothetical protein